LEGDTVDLDLVECFVTLAEEFHFGRAAARLQIGSPALSKRIAQLEGQWGVPLFDRTSRTVNLTPAGHMLLEPARHILREARALRDLAAEAATGVLGAVRAGYFSGTGEIMMRLAREVHKRFPDIVIYSQQMSHDRAFAAVEAGTVQCAIVRMPPGPGMQWLTLVAHKVNIVALPREHRLAGQEEVALADLAGESLLVEPPWIPRNSQLPLKLREIHTSNEVELFDLVAAGAGVIFATKDAVRRNPRHEVITKPLVGFCEVTRDLLIWRADERSPAVHSIRKVALELQSEFSLAAE
jgi:DNA-binding transcriptional LysR family regulator